MRLTFLLFLLAAALPVHAAPAYLGFDVTSYLPVETDVVAVGDLNSDGRADLVVAGRDAPHSSTYGLCTFLGTPQGTLVQSPVSTLLLSVGSMAIADVVGDSAPDLVYAPVQSYSLGDPVPPPEHFWLQVRPGLGNGTFGPELTAVPILAKYVTTADLDGDHKADILAATQSGLVILRGTSAGAPVVDRTLDYPVDLGIATGDLDGDGDLDLVLAPQSQTYPRYDWYISVLRNDGALNFSLQSSYGDFPDVNSHRVIALADLAGNGMPSLVFTDFASYGQLHNDVRVAPRTGTFTFGPSVPYAAGGQPWDLTIDDWNGDGRDDVAVAHYDYGAVSVFQGQPNGTLGVSRELPCGMNPRSVATGDLDGDGLSDIVAGSVFPGLNRLSIRPGNGLGGFGIDAVSLTRPRRSIVADVDRDGFPDLVAARASGAIAILHGDGNGALGPAQTIDVGTLASDVAATDLNGDGFLDLATANTSNSTVSVFMAIAPGVFAAPQNYSVGLFPLEIALREVTGDGFPDVVTVNDANSVSILPGLPGGGFAPRIDVPLGGSGSSPRGLAFGDVDEDGRDDIVTVLYHAGSLRIVHPREGGAYEVEDLNGIDAVDAGVAVIDANQDGHLDLAASSSDDAVVRVRLGTGGGSFSPPVAYPAPGVPGELAVCDWNGDGHPDLAFLDEGPPSRSGTFGLLVGDGAGHFALGGVTGVVNQPYGLAVGDLNRDGRPDFVVTSEVANGANVLLDQATGPIVGVSPSSAAPSRLRFASRMPARGPFMLAYDAPSADEGSVRILTARGAVVYQEKIQPNAAGAQMLRVAPTGLRGGVYWAEVRQGSFRDVVKFVSVP